MDSPFLVGAMGPKPAAGWPTRLAVHEAGCGYLPSGHGISLEHHGADFGMDAVAAERGAQPGVHPEIRAGGGKPFAVP